MAGGPDLNELRQLCAVPRCPRQRGPLVLGKSDRRWTFAHGGLRDDYFAAPGAIPIGLVPVGPEECWIGIELDPDSLTPLLTAAKRVISTCVQQLGRHDDKEVGMA